MRDEQTATITDPAAGAELHSLLEQTAETELPDAATCVAIARIYAREGESQEAYSWLARIVDAGDSFTHWSAAGRLLAKLNERSRPEARAQARLAIAGSYTTSQLATMLPLAALRLGIDLTVEDGQYGQYQQDLIDPGSALYRWAPDQILIAVDDTAAALPRHSETPSEDVRREAARWEQLWTLAGERSGAGVIQHNFARRPELPYGHLSAGLPGSRYAMLDALNRAIAERAGAGVSIVDCDRLAGDFGRTRWFDERYWFRAKQAVALDALPLLARHTAAVIAARMGLSRKCLVLDLDNTLWGGVIGEDGIEGIQLGGDAVGEAFVAFQELVLDLKARGVILAVASKNNDADAREVFERHPEMRIRLDDIAAWAVNWEDKPANLRRIAASLGIGLDSLVLADDNPAERQIVRRLVPEVDVIALPPEPADYRRALGEYLGFEPAAVTEEDRRRTDQYKARAAAGELASSAADIESFYRDLRMTAETREFDELNLKRIVQLIGKTNQFNLTTRRHTAEEVRRFMTDPAAVTRYLKLSDRLADHGLVALAIALKNGEALELETLLMSCRVIGRTVERHLLMHICREAKRLGCATLIGTYIPSAKNDIVRELYPSLGFAEVSSGPDGTTRWEYDLAARGPIESDFIGEAA